MDEEHSSKTPPAPKASGKGLITAIVVAAVVIGGSLVFLGMQMSGSSDGAADVADAPTAPPPALEITASVDELIDDDAMLGDADAPLTLIEFSDYECPFCKRHATQTMPDIKKNYIDTGKLKLVFRDYPLGFHSNAVPAALAAECARDQKGDEAYFEMHDKLFSGELSSEIYAEYAGELGLDMTAYNDCVDSGKFTDEINADMAAGTKYGVRGTPGFVLTDGETNKSIKGAQPYANFQQAFDALLN